MPARSCSRSRSAPSSCSPGSAARCFPGTLAARARAGCNAACISTVAFVVVERRAREPILPMSLFANRNFAVSSSVGFIVGLSLFGAVTFLPIYLQVVKGVSPSTSGLMLMPMMLGMLVTSIISGRLISRFGRYKLFPIIGTATMTFGLGALSLLSIESSRLADRDRRAVARARHGHGDAGADHRGAEQRRLRASRRGDLRHHAVPLARRRARGRDVRRDLRQRAARAARRAGHGIPLHRDAVGGARACRRTCTRNTSPRSWRRCGRCSWRRLPSPRSASRWPGCCTRARCARARRPRAWARASRCRATPPRWKSSSASSRVLVAHENRWRVYADLARRAGIDLPAPELWMLARLGEREPMTLASLSAELRIPQHAAQASVGRAVRSRHRREAHGRTAPAHARRHRAARPRSSPRGARVSPTCWRAGSPSSIPTCWR